VKLDWVEILVLTAAVIGIGVVAFLVIGVISSPI
jgi:hypothetical protein